MGPDVLLLTPVVNLSDISSGERERLGGAIAAEVVGSFEHLSVRTRIGESGEQLGALRTALVTEWREARVTGRGRLKAGARLDLGETLAAAASAGAGAITLTVLARAGSIGSADGFVPRPMDEIVPLPGDEFDYEVPKTGRAAATPGVEFDLLVVGATDGVVLAHRRVFHPASTRGEIEAALPVLAREATRGLTSAAP